MSCTVTIESDSSMIRQRWIFSVVGKALLLERYHYERRRSLNQQFATVKMYDRGNDRSYGDWTWLDEDDVPWDDEIQSLALDEFIAQWSVIRASELSQRSPAKTRRP